MADNTPRRPLRRFYLVRKEDRSGISGTGTVAEGVEWSDGSVALRWLTGHASTAIYANMRDFVHIHGHGGKSQVEWLDGKGSTAGGFDGRGETEG